MNENNSNSRIPGPENEPANEEWFDTHRDKLECPVIAIPLVTHTINDHAIGLAYPGTVHNLLADNTISPWRRRQRVRRHGTDRGHCYRLRPETRPPVVKRGAKEGAPPPENSTQADLSRRPGIRG